MTLDKNVTLKFYLYFILYFYFFYSGAASDIINKNSTTYFAVLRPQELEIDCCVNVRLFMRMIHERPHEGAEESLLRHSCIVHFLGHVEVHM